MSPPPRGRLVDTGRLRYVENRRGIPGPIEPMAIWSCSLHGEFAWRRRPSAAPTCYRCRSERDTYNRERRKAIRNPPRPPFEKVPDTCSMCGLSPLPGRRRSWCSDECVNLWAIATDGKAALHHLVGLHGGGCWECGDTTEPEREHHYSANPGALTGQRVPITLEVEHTRPLWSLTDEERTQLRWWLPFNLALMCRACHKAKSKREAAERAAIRAALLP